MSALHSDELPIDEDLVRTLVARQIPELAALPVTRLRSSGSSNALFRLGDELLVRMPRQPGGSVTIRKEARWSPYVGSALSVATPYVVALGEPADGYPEHWAVVRWIDGENPTVRTDQVAQHSVVHDLAGVVRAMRDLPVPPEALSDPALHWYRAGPVTAMDEAFREAVESCRSLSGLAVDLDAATAIWDDAMALGGSVSAPRWLHGDLLAENLLVRDGRLSAVLDLGGLAVGDPTVDLIAAWELLDAPGRATFRELVGVDDRTWILGRAWALFVSVNTFPYYWDTMPQRCASRMVMAEEVLRDAS